MNPYQAVLGAAVGAWYTLFAQRVAGLGGDWANEIKVGFAGLTFVWLVLLVSLVRATNETCREIHDADLHDLRGGLRLLGRAGKTVFVGTTAAAAMAVGFAFALRQLADAGSIFDGVYGAILVSLLLAGPVIDEVRQLLRGAAESGTGAV